METKEIETRLNIIKSAVEIGDTDTIFLQSSRLKTLNIKKIDEIIALLDSKNYRQALYLIKNFLSENSITDSVNNFEDDTEKVLGIEDMLKMSPLAKETIKEYKSNIYTQDDLEAFAKNIEVPISKAYEQDYAKSKNYEEAFQKIQEKQEVEDVQENVAKESSKTANTTSKINEEKIEIEDEAEVKNSSSEIKEDTETQLNEFDNAVENVDKDTPLDEISAQVLGKKEKPRKKVMSKYKTLRAKFARKDKTKDEETQEFKKSSVAKSVLDKAKNIGSELKSQMSKKSNNADIKNVIKKAPKENENKIDNKKVDHNNEIYSPIPHIEEKFRQAFVLYPPNKESDVWVEEVIKFLKFVSANSYTEKDIKRFFEEYDFYLEKGDISRASQVLLLASATDSKYAKFLLARELFQGRVLKRDLKKSYTLMKHLANQFYPDAICDLAQFYEYGIGVPKDKKTAVKLYEKAFELGVDRATKHINRIKESGGFLSSLLKFK